LAAGHALLTGFFPEPFAKKPAIGQVRRLSEREMNSDINSERENKHRFHA